MKSSDTDRNRWFFRFSLTLILALTLCLCCFLGWKSGLTKNLLQAFETHTVVRYSISLDGEGAEELVSRVKRQTGPAIWDDGGGTSVCKLEQSVDETERYLIVGANDTVQQEVERLLYELKAIAEAEPNNPINIVGSVDGIPVFQ